MICPVLDFLQIWRNRIRRTEQLQGLRLMKFEDVYGRCYRGDLSQAEASEILGMSERTFRRWRERYEAEGAAGLYDRRLGRVSARRAPVDEVMRVLELFETRYPDFTAKHFHEKLVCEHGFGLSYNWLRLSLQAHGKIKPAPRRGAHRRKRPRRPVVGMMLHQDGSSHAWVAGQWWDLIVTMDDATSEVYSGFFVAEEGTTSTFRGHGEVIAENGGSVRRFVLGPFCQTLTNLSPKKTANCVLASNHSRGGRFHASAA